MSTNYDCQYDCLNVVHGNRRTTAEQLPIRCQRYCHMMRRPPIRQRRITSAKKAAAWWRTQVVQSNIRELWQPYHTDHATYNEQYTLIITQIYTHRSRITSNIEETSCTKARHTIINTHMSLREMLSMHKVMAGKFLCDSSRMRLGSTPWNCCKVTRSDCQHSNVTF